METDCLAQQFVGADDDLYFAVGDALNDVTGFLRRLGAGKVLYGDGEVAQTFGEGEVVLVGK